MLMNTKAQSESVANLVLLVYLASMTLTAFLIYKNESVRRITTGHLLTKTKSA